MDSWADTLNGLAQQYVATAAAPKPNAAQTIDPNTGTIYQDGKPVDKTVKGMLSNPVVLIGGAVVVGLMVWLAVRK